MKKFSVLREGVPLSIRKLAQATGIPKSSVARHRQALQRRAVVPGAVLWEQSEGAQWLQRLVLAVVFVFGIKAGVGADRLSEFFHRVQLDRHVGSSPTALRRLREELEQVIIAYGAEQEAWIQQRGQRVEICAGADETFFDQVVLVMMDLVSGYIVVEEAAADRTYGTWQERAQRALERLGMGLRYVVSDRAKALVKLALEGFSCPSIPDVFHVLRDLAKAMSLGVSLRIARVDEKLTEARQRLAVLEAKGKDTHVQQRLIRHLSAQSATLHTDQETFQTLLRQASQAIHPFVISDSRRQSAAELEQALHQTVAALNALRARYTCRDNAAAVAKVTTQVPALASLVDSWWGWVEHSVASTTRDADLQRWLLERLLPAVYWQQQVDKTSTPVAKAAYQQAFDHAREALRQHPLSAELSAERFAVWHAWALDWVMRFQRASSPVEGRNGYLSQLNHCARGTPQQRLKVITVIHNFDLQRTDGTTAAERLFGTPFPDLFEWIMERMGPLPLPRKPRAISKPKRLNLQTVPS